VFLRHNFEWLNNLVNGDEKWCLYVNFKSSMVKTGQAAKPTPKPVFYPQKRMLRILLGVKGSSTGSSFHK
jgi:hypothetical protein